MRILNWKKSLIFLVILLVCSITPVVAVQMSETNNISENATAEWNKGLENALNFASNQEYTELTPEQDAYAESHQDQIRIRGEAVLDNIQNYLNYAKQEYTNAESSSKDVNMGNFTEDMEQVLKHLNNKNIKVKQETYTYEDLSYNVNKDTNPLDPGTVIVQIKDKDDVVYAKLVKIDANSITLKKKGVDVNWAKGAFVSDHSMEGSLNVIIVPTDQHSVDDVLGSIYEYKKSIFRDAISGYGTGITTGYASEFFGMVLIAVALVKCCNFDVRRSAMILMANLRYWPNQANVGSDIPRGYMEFDRDEIRGSYAFRNHEKTIGLLVLGVIISALSFPLTLYLKRLKDECNTRLDNLNEWG